MLVNLPPKMTHRGCVDEVIKHRVLVGQWPLMAELASVLKFSMDIVKLIGGYVGQHPNLVRILAAVKSSRSDAQAAYITEFCFVGTLTTVMRAVLQAELANPKPKPGLFQRAAALFKSKDSKEKEPQQEAKQPESNEFTAVRKWNILRDIADALVYLHGHAPPVIHGSLHSDCVYLTHDWHAKIHPPLPGELCVFEEGFNFRAAEWMPQAKHEFVSSPVLDIYSFGCIMIHVLTGACLRVLCCSACVQAKRRGKDSTKVR